MRSEVVAARRMVRAVRDATEVLGPDATDEAVGDLALALERDARLTSRERVMALVGAAERRVRPCLPGCTLLRGHLTGRDSSPCLSAGGTWLF